MTGRSLALPRTLLLLLGGIVSAVALVLLWTTFTVYDDEGYVLYSLRAFSEHGHLYDEVYSQYGPFFHVFYRALHALGFPLTNTGARIATLVCWIGSAGFCSAVVWRETRRNLLAAAATFTGVFIHLQAMVAEPSHPGGFISLLVAIAAWAGTAPAWRSEWRAAVLGAITAALLLTKINTGVFLVASLGAWWAFQSRAGTSWRWLAGAGLAAVPPLVMGRLLSTPWVATYAVVVSAGALGLAMAAAGGESPVEPRRRDAVVAIVAALIVSSLTCTAVLLGGTSGSGLLEGALLGPLRHPLVFSLPLHWRPGALLVALLAAPTAWWLSHLPPERRTVVLLPARVALLGAFAACALQLLPLWPSTMVLSYGVATAWVFVMPSGADDRTFAARLWLGLLLVMQSLHAYPVAGSQVGWGTVLWVPLAVLGAAELGGLLRHSGLRRALIALGAGAVVTVTGMYAVRAVQQARQSDAIGLPGAGQIRPPPATASALRMLARNTERHGDMLFTMPGMMSFNAWTNVPPPTVANATHWFNLLSLQQQEDIRQRLSASPRSVIIVQRYIYDFLERERIVTHTPLVNWLSAEYAPLFTVESYEFWVRKGRAVVPVDAARCFTSKTGRPTRYKLEIVIDARQRTEVSSFELIRFDGGRRTVLGAWSDANSAFILSPISADGVATGPAERRMLPLTVDGLVRIELYTESIDPSALRSGVIVLRDPQGRRVGEAHLIQ